MRAEDWRILAILSLGIIFWICGGLTLSLLPLRGLPLHEGFWLALIGIAFLIVSYVCAFVGIAFKIVAVSKKEVETPKTSGP